MKQSKCVAFLSETHSVQTRFRTLNARCVGASMGRAVYSVILIAPVLLTASCKNPLSSPRALESKDWFRDGVDRFYLAVAPQGQLIEGTTTGARVGQDMLFGVGCFGEPKDQAAPVDVPGDACGNGPSKIPLNQRFRVSQFPLAADPGHPKKGECIVVLGDDDLFNHMQLFPKDYATGGGGAALQSFFVSAGVCGATLALMYGPTRNAVGSVMKSIGSTARDVAVTGKEALGVTGRFFWSGSVPRVASAAGGGGVEAATRIQSELLKNRLVAPIQGGFSNVQRLTTAAANQTTRFKSYLTNNSPALKLAGSVFGPVTHVAGKVLSVFPCFDVGTSLWGLVTQGQLSQNRKAFFQGLTDAERLTNEYFSKSPAGEQYRALMAAGNPREAAALYNPIFARLFNEKVFGQFEQGWAVFGNRPQNFFDTVQSIQDEILAYAQKAGKGEATPETGFGQAVANTAPTVAPQTLPTK